MEEKNALFSTLIKKIEEIINKQSNVEEKLKSICKLLKENVPYYDWVGFYLVDKKRKEELVLGPFEGTQTEHTRIPFGRGICGQAAKLKETFIVQDVSKEENYLACSPEVRSEIVIPIFKDGEIVGELDIDSHQLSPFTSEDKNFLEEICKMLSKIL